MQVAEIRTRFSDEQVASSIASALVEERLVACAHVRGPLESHYRWQEVHEVACEWELDVVTPSNGVDLAVKRIIELHPYEVPAILVTTSRTTDAYGSWVEENTGTLHSPM